jgi:hypothetical protein
MDFQHNCLLKLFACECHHKHRGSKKYRTLFRGKFIRRFAMLPIAIEITQSGNLWAEKHTKITNIILHKKRGRKILLLFSKLFNDNSITCWRLLPVPFNRGFIVRLSDATKH